MERGFLSMEKKGGLYGICWRRFHPLYDYFFGIGEGIGKLLKLLLLATLAYSR
jgi:hypothetical protein